MDPLIAPGPAAAATAAAPAPGPRSAMPSDFSTFLRMLTAQMRNQDPLDPIDSADYAVQLATFAGVEQQVKTNALLDGLGGQLALGGLGELAAWVGREARAAMPGYFDGTPLTLSPNPAAGADRAELVVRDGAGREVARTPIPVAAAPIEWAGVTADGAPLPTGLYRFEVVSQAGDTVLSTQAAELYARVTEVRAVGGEVVLVMEGGATVPTSAVTALREA